MFIKKHIARLTSLALILPLILFSCKNSKPVRLYNTGKELYDDAQATGDYTWLILFIVGLVILGLLWLKNKKDND